MRGGAGPEGACGTRCTGIEWLVRGRPATDPQELLQPCYRAACTHRVDPRTCRGGGVPRGAGGGTGGGMGGGYPCAGVAPAPPWSLSLARPDTPWPSCHPCHTCPSAARHPCHTSPQPPATLLHVASDTSVIGNVRSLVLDLMGGCL